MASLTPLLSTQNVKRHFGGLKAVDGVDFTLYEGEIRAIIGPNGAGKTTFVSLLSGRTEVSDGTITFAGEDVTRLPAYKRVQRGIAYTFQITNIYPTKTAAEMCGSPSKAGRPALATPRSTGMPQPARHWMP